MSLSRLLYGSLCSCACLLVLAMVPVSSESLAESKAFFFKPVPQPQTNATALSYHQIPIAHGPLHDEQLIDISELGIAGESYYARRDHLNAPYYQPIPGAHITIYARLSAAKKLQAVNELLAPLGVELFVLDAYRPIQVQQALWQYFMAKAAKDLHTTNVSTLRAYAGKYCSDPTGFDAHNPSTFPTHITGGAVDLTLRCKRNGQWLFMGTVFDEDRETAATDYFEQHDDGSASAEDARRNRRLLFWAMSSAGFANYSREWWHYDWGNQMWLQSTRSYGLDKNIPSEAPYGLAHLAGEQ